MDVLAAAARNASLAVALAVAGCATTTTPAPTLAADPLPAGPAAAADDAEVAAAIAAWRADRAASSDAARVAQGDDGVVRFTDEVVAVSHGNGVVFLSFGRPYPEQVLSVKIDAELWWALPDRAMLSREVEVMGELRHGPGGPIVTVARVDDIAIVPVDEHILEPGAIDPSVKLSTRFARRLRLALTQRLERAEPMDPELPPLLERVYRSVDAIPPGHKHIDMFFRAVGLPADADDTRFIRRWGQLTAWRAAFPSSVGASLTEATLHVNRGWAIRGTGFINTVGLSERRQFAEALERAGVALDAEPATRLTTTGLSLWFSIALGEGWPTSRVDALFTEATVAFPGHVPFYAAAVRRLLPHWYGQPGAAEAFLEEQRALIGGEDGDVLYARVAWELHAQYPHALFKRTSLSWPTTARGLEALIARAGPNLRLWRSVYARLAAETGDINRLGPALEAMGDDADMHVWVNLQNVESARRMVRDVKRRREAERIDDE